MNFSIVYNPKTKATNQYVESKVEESDLWIENFEKTKKFYFKKLEKIDFDSIDLNSSNEISSTQKEYIEFVNRLKLEIKTGDLTKGVAAQKQVENSNNSNLDFEKLFQKMIQNFENTFVYLFYIENSIWLGASPEIIGVLEGTNFQTISLAGTISDKNTTFGAKEIEEQNIVSRVIESQLKISDTTTCILNFGSIQHLINEYNMNVKPDFDFEKMINEIHPSPALAGYPKEKSIQFILENEKIEREFYCGLVALKEDKNNYSYATIRCARFTKNQVINYAGAGITADSNPVMEWEETMSKIGVLKNIILC
jgi:isochorismate synthase